MIRHHSEPGLNILNELRLTLSSPALKNFKTSAGSVKKLWRFQLAPKIEQKQKASICYSQSTVFGTVTKKNSRQGEDPDGYLFNDF